MIPIFARQYATTFRNPALSGVPSDCSCASLRVERAKLSTGVSARTGVLLDGMERSWDVFKGSSNNKFYANLSPGSDATGTTLSNMDLTEKMTNILRRVWRREWQAF